MAHEYQSLWINKEQRKSDLKAEKQREKELKAVAFHPAVLALG